MVSTVPTKEVVVVVIIIIIIIAIARSKDCATLIFSPFRGPPVTNGGYAVVIKMIIFNAVF